MRFRVLRLSCWLYAVMLRAYPYGYRCEYSREMMLLFENRARDVLEHGGSWAMVPFATHIVSDWLRTVIRERKDEGIRCPLGLGVDGDGVTCAIADADRQARSVSLMLAVLGMFLLIVGWSRWATSMRMWR
jgi:hypothetical protein